MAKQLYMLLHYMQKHWRSNEIIKSCDNLWHLFHEFLTFIKDCKRKERIEGLKERPWHFLQYNSFVNWQQLPLYHISLNKSLGVYYLPSIQNPAFKLGRLLFGTRNLFPTHYFLLLVFIRTCVCLLIAVVSMDILDWYH